MPVGASQERPRPGIAVGSEGVALTMRRPITGQT